jgi:hypothetical protein
MTAADGADGVVMDLDVPALAGQRSDGTGHPGRQRIAIRVTLIEKFLTFQVSVSDMSN